MARLECAFESGPGPWCLGPAFRQRKVPAAGVRLLPLMQLYRDRPWAGTIVLSASGVVGGQCGSCSVLTGQALVSAGLHTATGIDGTLACSGDLLLQALVACAGVSLAAVAANRGIAGDGNVRATGELGVRGTLGLDPEVPVGFGSIRPAFELDTDPDPETAAGLLAATEKYCVVLQTLRSTLQLQSVLVPPDGGS